MLCSLWKLFFIMQLFCETVIVKWKGGKQTCRAQNDIDLFLKSAKVNKQLRKYEFHWERARFKIPNWKKNSFPIHNVSPGTFREYISHINASLHFTGYAIWELRKVTGFDTDTFPLL